MFWLTSRQFSSSFSSFSFFKQHLCCILCFSLSAFCFVWNLERIGKVAERRKDTKKKEKIKWIHSFFFFFDDGLAVFTWNWSIGKKHYAVMWLHVTNFSTNNLQRSKKKTTSSFCNRQFLYIVHSFRRIKDITLKLGGICQYLPFFFSSSYLFLTTFIIHMVYCAYNTTAEEKKKNKSFSRTSSTYSKWSNGRQPTIKIIKTPSFRRHH